ncbi:MAG: Asp-tRNA(Asn)/Glu-tRNA(Gln) amidotransferase subunit GatA [Candidatus Micrarchaeota archaeon]|nr:Asp-tRNA(Asn)/Glu-tRNA(Gln) amidotransferase subunit GatA [Candidatus Micrarchaeota archaeon]
MDVKKFLEDAKSGSIDIVEHTSKVIEETKKIDRDYHYFNEISEELAMELAKRTQRSVKEGSAGIIAGLPVSLKDAICVKGVETRAGSAILAGYVPVFDSFVAQRIKEEGGIIIGKNSQDAFGFGSFSMNVGKGMKIPKNPIDPKRVAGGSSGGSAGIVAKAGFPIVSVAESTGGSIEAPASFCGVTGFCPTYGRVSRNGLISYANSLDKIGPMGKSVFEIALILEVISGHDPKDSTSAPIPAEKYTEYAGKGANGMKIGVIKEVFSEGTDENVTDSVWKVIKKLESEGVPYEEISLPTVMKYGISAYYTIAMAEASTNLARYCGMRYGAQDEISGSFNEYFSEIRTKYLNDEEKRRILIGTFVRMAGFRDAFYLKAAKVRTMIINEYKSAFRKFDFLLSPTMPQVAPTFEDAQKLTPLQSYMMDVMTVGPNLAGIPHMNMNAGAVHDLPAGFMLMADHFREGKLIQIGSFTEDVL